MEDSSNALDLLESVLDQAFVAPPRETLQPSNNTPTQEETNTPTETETAPVVTPEETSRPTETATESTDDSWKAEYEAQVQNWRAQSAEAREKAEKERLKWESIRAIERGEAAKRKAAGIVDEPVMSASVTQSETWENVEEFTTTTTTDSSRVIEIEQVEPETLEQPSADESTPNELARTDSQLEMATNESQKWEDVPSVTSSFPSMTFPDHIETPPAHPQPAPQPAPVSVTLAIFDSSLSARTRVTALFSSLAVNLFLPFINGVMLGFGEIFAKNVVMQWFGWKPFGPAPSVANVGLRGAREDRQRQSK